MLLFQMWPVFFIFIINNFAPFECRRYIRIILYNFAEFLHPVLAVININVLGLLNLNLISRIDCTEHIQRLNNHQSATRARLEQETLCLTASFPLIFLSVASVYH